MQLVRSPRGGVIAGGTDRVFLFGLVQQRTQTEQLTALHGLEPSRCGRQETSACWQPATASFNHAACCVTAMAARRVAISGERPVYTLQTVIAFIECRPLAPRTPMQVAFCQALAAPAAASGSVHSSRRSFSCTASQRLVQQRKWQGSATAATAAAARAASGSLPHPRHAAGLRCQAAAEASDVIDVDGKVVDDRVPVTVSWGSRKMLMPGEAVPAASTKWTVAPLLSLPPPLHVPLHRSLPGSWVAARRRC